VWAVLAVGISLRLAQYLRHDSLWGDEAMLALSIASRRFDGLLTPLAYGQVAPVPFLWAERLMVAVFGVNEWALRALPLLAGAALCLAVILVGRRILRSDEVVVALVLIAFSQVLIRYSAEVKSYSWDALLAVALVAATTPLIVRIDDRGSWLRLAVVGTVAVLSSLTSPFVCFGASLTLALHAFRRGRLDLVGRTCLVALLWAILFSVPYRLLYQGPASAPYMRTYWEGSFLIPGSPHLVARTEAALVEAFRGIDAGWTLLGLSALTLGLVLLGTATLWRRRCAPHALVLLVPCMAPFAASAAGAYPISTRLMLFAAPLAIMLTAVGVMAAARSVHNILPAVRPRWVAAVLLLPAVTIGISSTLVPRDQQLRPLIQELKRDWRGHDAAYVFHRVVPAWLFHSTEWAEPNNEQLAWAMRVSGPEGLGHENGPSRGSRAPGEGKDLVYDLDGHPILLGTSSGVQGRPRFAHQVTRPDEGWAANEAQRMRTTSSVVWVILGNAAQDGVDLGEILLDAARRAGGRLTFQDSLFDGRLYRLDFHSTKR
jgi:Dolichyl-phosphate-mannose-protein mannosyltransferase